jgi:hypothetical protein
MPLIYLEKDVAREEAKQYLLHHGSPEVYPVEKVKNNVSVLRKFSSDLEFNKFFVATEGNNCGSTDAVCCAVLAARTASPLILIKENLTD